MSKKKTVNSHNNTLSLISILWCAVSQCFVLSVIIAFIPIGLILIFQRNRFYEYLPLVFGFFIIMVITMVIYPMFKAYFFVRHQEQVTGRKYLSFTNKNISMENREWFIACMGNKMTIINRFYIKKVKKISIGKAETEDGSSKWYQVEYINCLGESKKFPLEKLKSEVDRFSLWNNAKSMEIPEDEEFL